MLQSVVDGIHKLMRWLGALAAFLLIALVFLLTFNVIMRYAFNASSIGLEELSWHFYAAVFLLGIPYALQTGSHVRVDLIHDRLSARNKAIIDLVGTLIFLIPTCLIVVWTGWQFTTAAYGLGYQPGSLAEFFTQITSTGIGEKSQDPGGLLNRWIIKGVIPFAFLCLLLAAVALLLESIQRLQDALKEA